MSKFKSLLAKVARPVELILAAVFLLGAILKAADVNLFILQISHYGVLADRSLIVVAALATLAIETGLATTLLLRIRLRGITYAGILALLAGFTGLILYGWIFSDLKDCGCFGPIEISPAASIGKNILIAALALAAWAGLASTGKLGSTWRRLTVTIPAAIIAALAVSAYSYAHVEPPAPPGTAPFAQFVFQSGGKTTDLGKGEYLVAILSMECEHCMETVPGINELQKQPGVPELVALCYEPAPGDLEKFREATAPEFPLLSMGRDVGKFFSLIGTTPPRFALVRDGVQIHYWDNDPPPASEVVEALKAKPSDSAT
jgi:thiol-disulfide isomerase/thioredoxin